MENLENEIWKPIGTIVNKNGSYTPIGYEVSNMGRVRTKRQRYGRPRKSTGQRGEASLFCSGDCFSFGYGVSLWRGEKE